jgi:hypothetical protein
VELKWLHAETVLAAALKSLLHAEADAMQVLPAALKSLLHADQAAELKLALQLRMLAATFALQSWMLSRA